MSGEKATTSCNKFQANVFNTSKCQNCFKSRELHLLGDRDVEQAKPIYCSWLCLAPVGTDFDNPVQRSRKWQRRFFVLYEHGSLSYALDQQPSTLPQGTVSMSLCTDISDAESRTGQRNALCIKTPEQEIFIRGDNKEIINGWREQLSAYLRTNKHSQKKKRKVEPIANQEPSPAKMAATDLSFAPTEGASEGTPVRTSTDPQGPEWIPAGSGPPSSSAFDSVVGSSGQIQGEDRRSAEPVTRKERVGGAAVPRQGRMETRTSKREKLPSCADVVQTEAPPPQRRAKSLDRRTSDTVMTPDLLNFKKGWMVKLEENDQWKKYWFVLSADSLRYYRDPLAEEASDLEGEIDLAKCYSVSEYQVQRNYGFQIHTLRGVFTLSAMTAGIRENWIQVLMKNVHPANAPDVASLPGPPEVLPKPDVTQDSDVITDRRPPAKPRSLKEERQDGNHTAFDWAEFRPQAKLTAEAERQETGPPRSLELDYQERRRRREERRQRYERELLISFGREESGEKVSDGTERALSPKSQRRVEEEIEECWKQVERTVFRAERTLPLNSEARDTAEVEDLKIQLAESERLRLQLEAELTSHRLSQQQMVPPLRSEADFCSENTSKTSVNDLKDSQQTSTEQRLIGEDVTDALPLNSSSSAPRLPNVCLQHLEDFFPETEVSSALDGRHELCLTDGPELNFDAWNGLGREDCQRLSSSDTKTNNGELFTPENPAGKDGRSLTDVAPDLLLVKTLSKELELLSHQNAALHQHNQEVLNQLTEADREIERLKAELSSRYTEPHHLPEVEQQEKMRLEDLEKELSLRNQELLEAQMLIMSLRESEALTQLKNLTGSEGSEDENKNNTEKTDGYLLRCFEATEAKLTELERQLEESRLSCRELQQKNAELEEAGSLCSESLEKKLCEECERRLNGEGENRTVSSEDRTVSSEEKIRKVIQGMLLRQRVLGKLLGVIEGLGCEKETEEVEESPTVGSQLRREEEMWRETLNRLKEETRSDDPVDALVLEGAECQMVERQILLAGYDLLLRAEEERGGEGEGGWWGSEVERLKADTQRKISLLLRISSLSVSELDGLRPAADRLYPSLSEPPGPAHILHPTAIETLSRCRLKEKSERPPCPKCVSLLEENRQLKATWRPSKDVISTCCQTEESRDPDSEEMEIPPLGEHKLSEEMDEEGEVLSWRGKVKELEEQLFVSEGKTREEFEEKTRVLQLQHEAEMEKLKVTCERGLTSMEESLLKVVDELQRLHQQELEFLRREKDRLLEEEAAATAIALEAFRNAHRVELQREVQRSSSYGNAQMEDVHRQHREELDSFQRELDALSQQFSLRCLENRHLVQALDAERKALCQCQLENQDLRTRNQELSGHLAAEITRLCSLAKRDELPLGLEMDAFEMAITLRVKESEVQCLKQEIKSLRDDLQSALQDKRNASKKYTDVNTELSSVRAKADREAEELRENLRLAHHALRETSP
uniref:(Atlantic silverside) hypothetical protein n=1 Tax=Menidia menidia TaxID=238744 RepID=A0A8S4BCQ6_9TELE|nr:unnamed protein product [Menidia menidia]